jgi:hypothetical protein
MATNQNSQQHADKIAQSMGFPSAAAYLAWKQKKDAALVGPDNSNQTTSAHDLLNSSMMWHPAWMLDAIAKKIGEATGSK